MNEETIFAVAREKKTPAERQAYLEEACAGNAGVRAAVEELLRAEADAGSFLEHAPAGLEATIVSGSSSKDTVNSGHWATALPFLQPCDKPGRIGVLDQYEIIEVVGHGGMGAVLRAFDTKLSRVVAVKVMSPTLAANATAVKRFLREATTAASVHHDHVVTIHAVDDAHQPPYLVMQFVEGQTLQQKIDREGALELKHILRIGSQAAAGLAAAHKLGLIHRDVKPANILLENGVERVKITDFGLARAADDVQMTQTGIIAGTPQYMSPEQARGEPIDARSDLFSLGSVLYTMCTGRPAFRADNPVAVLRRVCDDAPRPIREVNPEIPEWLEAIVNKLLAKDPSDRLQTAGEVADLLNNHLAHVQNPALVSPPAMIVSASTNVARPSAAQQRPKRRSPGQLVIEHPVLGTVAIVMLLISAAAATYMLTAAVARITRATLVLDADYPDAKLRVNQDAKLVAELDRGWYQRRLPAGVYDLSMDIGESNKLGIAELTIDNGPEHGKNVTRMGRYNNRLPRNFRFAAQLDRGSRTVIGLKLVEDLNPPTETAAGSPGFDFARFHHERIQGTWAAISGEGGGQPISGNDLVNLRLEFNGDHVKAQGPGPTGGGEGTFELDTTATPRRLKITRQEGPNRFAVMDGIYDLDGDRLKICMGEPEENITEFKSRPGTNILLAEFVRLTAALEPSSCRRGLIPRRRAQESVYELSANNPLPQPVDLAKWGRFVDPRGDCGLKRESNRITITVPGGTPHNLLPGERYNFDAPRLMNEIDGNFVAQVIIPPYPRPLDGSAARGNVSYRSAGFVVWVDEKSLLRFERNGWGEQRAGAPFLHVEWHVDGQYRGDETEFLPDQPDGPTHLQLERRGSELHLLWSRDGKAWTPWRIVRDMNLSSQVSIGLAVQNSTNAEYSAVFERLAIAKK